MKFFEYGNQHSQTMVMLHGGGVSFLGAVPLAKIMAEKFHVILVSYDGFNPTEPTKEFVSIAEEERQIAEFLLKNVGGKVDVLYGVSYGCRVLMALLEDSRLQFTTAIADGFSTRDYPDIHSKLGKDIYLFFFTGFFYVIMGRAGKRRKKLIAKLTGRTEEEAQRLIYTKASWNSWRNQDLCLIGTKTNFDAFKNTDMNLWYGSESTVEKKLAGKIAEWKKNGYAFQIKVFPGLGHGGLAGEQPYRFREEVLHAHQNTLKKMRESTTCSQKESVHATSE